VRLLLTGSVFVKFSFVVLLNMSAQSQDNNVNPTRLFTAGGSWETCGKEAGKLV
jgi:hypothetical protein